MARKVTPAEKDEMFARLRRNILLARLKVSLDEELKRPTSPRQKALAEMKLPPLRSHSHVTRAAGRNGSVEIVAQRQVGESRSRAW